MAPTPSQPEWKAGDGVSAEGIAAGTCGASLRRDTFLG